MVCGAPLFADSTPGSGRDTLICRPSITETLPNGKEIDSSWIVSYNIYLLLKYACHTNAVVCKSVKLIKYLYTYNFKGGDRDMLELGAPRQDGQPPPPLDEIAEFEDLQSCGTTEACWRLYGFDTIMLYPTVQRFYVHLENQNRLACNEGTINGF
jgi:hypothetical protein